MSWKLASRSEPNNTFRRRILMSRIAYCTARNQDQANRIVEHLRNEGFTNHDISVLMYQNGEIKHVNGEGHETHAAEGTAAGVGTGAVLGGALGWLTGIGAIAIPGVGALIAAGPIAAALSGIAIGGTVGGVSGGLIGLGIPKDEASQYEKKLHGGNILISVFSATDGQNEEAKELFAREGADDIYCVPAASDTHAMPVGF
jgi:hypothetical protein